MVIGCGVMLVIPHTPNDMMYYSVAIHHYLNPHPKPYRALFGALHHPFHKACVQQHTVGPHLECQCLQTSSTHMLVINRSLAMEIMPALLTRYPLHHAPPVIYHLLLAHIDID